MTGSSAKCAPATAPLSLPWSPCARCSPGKGYLAVEWAERGISVNAVAPGTIRTERVPALVVTGVVLPVDGGYLAR